MFFLDSMSKANAATLRRTPRWLQFRLRTCFLAITVVCLIAASWAGVMQKAREKREEADRLKALGAILVYESRVHTRPAWLRVVCGDDIIEVDLRGDNGLAGRSRNPFGQAMLISRVGGDESLTQSMGIPTVPGLDRPNTGGSLGQLSSLAALKHLGTLKLADISMTDQDLVDLTGLKELESLDLSGTPVTDAGLVHVGDVVSLRELNLRNSNIPWSSMGIVPGHFPLGTFITDAGVAHVLGLRNLQSLNLERAKITDNAMVSVQMLAQLRILNIANTQVGDVGLRQLCKMPNLKRLDVRNTRVSDSGIAELRKAIPGLIIER